ncbi:Hypothetical protein I595_3373 [Croceitalea dokdonensis DOKDO 023]|uniref:Uncharacterized protein n=1 Tax=Croceitalea dokdonensis DOKDO 023 TaxID=1300341 RepID=A0A0P7AE95_9FLAO|nr:Hypothetical protein I595_3373 [Croceitalea dokdonensis DOKDO 023]
MEISIKNQYETKANLKQNNNSTLTRYNRIPLVVVITTFIIFK